MKLGNVEGRERSALYLSLLLVVIVFGVSVYKYYNPPVQIFEAKVFDVEKKPGLTIIYSVGASKLKLYDDYDIEIGATYRIVYQSRRSHTANIVLSLEKLDG